MTSRAVYASRSGLCAESRPGGSAYGGPGGSVPTTGHFATDYGAGNGSDDGAAGLGLAFLLVAITIIHDLSLGSGASGRCEEQQTARRKGQAKILKQILSAHNVLLTGALAECQSNNSIHLSKMN
ncbi:hypothetical protein [Asticcacaulis sp. AND118]|uniref:hypothetical protein n=1 Tax=Asticcacaulis sp. AND118 TaxID=2840468 RepID=UPI001CFFB072|nr:hypothetical protein [Asticcacaulis sp. AND118]UDF05656.1 hypothetical protein LH365_16465 [Asticcacaulis sp. AND118]